MLKFNLLLPISLLLPPFQLGLQTRIRRNENVRLRIIDFEFEVINGFGCYDDDLLARHTLSPLFDLSLPLLSS